MIERRIRIRRMKNEDFEVVIRIDEEILDACRLEYSRPKLIRTTQPLSTI